jgi:hypothetical protein
MKVTHLLESTKHRQQRMNRFCHTQPLCGNGYAWANVTSDPKQVTCHKCKALLVKYPNAHK